MKFKSIHKKIKVGDEAWITLPSGRSFAAKIIAIDLDVTVGDSYVPWFVELPEEFLDEATTLEEAEEYNGDGDEATIIVFDNKQFKNFIEYNTKTIIKKGATFEKTHYLNVNDDYINVDPLFIEEQKIIKEIFVTKPKKKAIKKKVVFDNVREALK